MPVCRYVKKAKMSFDGEWYKSSVDHDGVASGAYIFRPDGLHKDEAAWQTTTIHGPVLTEIRLVCPTLITEPDAICETGFEFLNAICVKACTWQSIANPDFWRSEPTICAILWVLDDWHSSLKYLMTSKIPERWGNVLQSGRDDSHLL